MNEFKKPDFSVRDLELRFENNVVCIYGTEKGLKKLTELINKLIGHPAQGHIHIEDSEILTKESAMGAIAIFSKN